jgi:hypothetical protein
VFLRNGEVLGSVLHSAVPRTEPEKSEGVPGHTGDVLDDIVPSEVEVEEAKPAPEPKKAAAPAKKAPAPAFQSVLDKKE